jgi:hypothetical protein
MTTTLPRRAFLGRASAALVFLWVGGPRARRRAAHPDPRPGIDASRVLTREQLADSPDAISAFDQVREIPGVVDGIRCSCGCARREGFYSLLSCYEGDGMARHCEVCQGTGRLAYRLHRQGKSLAEIREAVDLRFR